jgi:hypothetical protein
MAFLFGGLYSSTFACMSSLACGRLGDSALLLACMFRVLLLFHMRPCSIASVHATLWWGTHKRVQTVFGMSTGTLEDYSTFMKCLSNTKSDPCMQESYQWPGQEVACRQNCV